MLYPPLVFDNNVNQATSQKNLSITLKNRLSFKQHSEKVLLKINKR